MFLHGIFPPITTPFYPDGKIYHRKLEQNVEHYSRTPTAGIVVLGSTGEAILLSDDERREALKTAIDAAANEKVMIAGTGVESALGTLQLTEYAHEIGYDVAMVRTPHYYKGQMANPQNMLAFYRFVCDRSPLPVIIYNFPQGWYFRSSATWNFNLKNGDYSIPVGAGVGKAWKMGGTTYNLLPEPQWTVSHQGDGQPKFQVFMGMNLQFPL